MPRPKTRIHQERRASIARTAIALGVLVALVYLFFVGRAVLNYFS